MFFVLMCLGIGWQRMPSQEGMAVDMWVSLPEPAGEMPAPVPATSRKPLAVNAAQHQTAITKADIELAQRQAPEPAPATAGKPATITAQAPAAAVSAADSSLINAYRLMIVTRIRRNIVMPPGVPDDMKVEFEVVLSPDGSLLRRTLASPSGSAAYDLAVDRAIARSQPLPLPPDPALFELFRELHLTFRPKA